MGYDILTGYAALATLGNDGNLYYANGSRLMMVPLTRSIDAKQYAIGMAVETAENAISQLPGSYHITFSNQSEIQKVRGLVNSAVKTGAAEESIRNLSKLRACETALENQKTYQIEFLRHSFDFGTFSAGSSGISGSTASFTLKNTGNQQVTVKLPHSSAYWISEKFPLTLTPGETAEIQIRPLQNLEAGNYQERILFEGDHGGAGNFAVVCKNYH